MPEIERAIECMPEIRKLQKRVTTLEEFILWVLEVDASCGQMNLPVRRIAEEARIILDMGIEQ